MADVDELVEELSRIKLYDPDEYKKRLATLKATQPLVYQEVKKILSIPDTGIISSRSGVDPYKIFKKGKTKIKKNYSGLIIAIVGTLIIGMVIIGVIGLFLGSIPTTSETGFNANQSLLLGYDLFNTLDLYLQYSTNTNLTTDKIYWITGREYYKYNQGDYTIVLINNEYECPYPSSCSLNNPNVNLISRKTSDNLLYNTGPNCSSLTMTDYSDFQSNHVLSIYDELYYYVVNGYVTESYRESVWTINSEQCAPMYFVINPPIDLVPNGASLFQLLYEVCLSNYGIPLAIGKYYYYTNHAEVFSAYLESTNEELLSTIQVNGKTLDSWSASNLNC